jgi:two-component system response regulator YesN
MHKVVILDDEPWVIRNMIDFIDWHSYGYEIAGTESNSIRGFEMLCQLKPELALVDIRMPELNGLELIRKCQALHLPTLFIVVSGVAEFSYVQKCLNLGAIGYCLKPVVEEEMIPLIHKASGLIIQEDHDDISFFEWILDERLDGQSHVMKLLEQANMRSFREKGLQAVCCLDCDIPEALEHYRYMKVISGKRKNMYIVLSNPSRPIVSAIQAHKPQAYRGIGISAPVFHINDLRTAVEEANIAACQYFLSGQPSVHHKNREEEEAGYSEFLSISALLNQGNTAAIMDKLDDLGEQFTSGAYLIKHAYVLFNTVITTILQAASRDIKQLESCILLDYEQLIIRYQNVSEMIDDLKRMAVVYLGNMLRDGASGGRNETFESILRFVQAHFNENLSLQILANRFFMNPNYISQLFIKYMGLSYTDYLTRLRIEQARHLLHTSGESIHSIGLRVGFNDSYYFSKIFKKITGKTPRDYRGRR